MTENTQGVTTALYVLFMTFIGINMMLAIRAYKHKKDRSRGQAIIVYANWSILIGAHLVIAFKYVPWRVSDYYFIIGAILATVTTLMIAKTWKGLGYEDAIVRGIVACLCKAGPQLYLTGCIIMDRSGQGLAATTIWAGHASVLTRIAHLAYCGKRTGVDRNIKGILISEIGNEISWICVTAAWLYFQKAALY